MEDINVKRDTENLGRSRKEVIQITSDIDQGKSFFQAENHLYYLIREKRLTHLKRLGWFITAQAKTTEQSHICISQHYHWHMMIEAECKDMRQKNSPRDIFIRFSHYFQLNLDETSFLFNEVDLRFIGSNDKPRQYKNCSDWRFLITVLRVGSAAGVNVPVIFLTKGKNLHPRLRGNNLMTKYVFPEGFFDIPNKSAYMDHKTWEKVVKLLAPGIRKMEMINVAFFEIFYSRRI